MEKIKILFLEKFCIEYYQKYKKYQTQPSRANLAKSYLEKFKKAKTIRDAMLSIAKEVVDDKAFGKIYTVVANSLEEYIYIYKILNCIPGTHVKMVDPNLFLIEKDEQNIKDIIK